MLRNICSSILFCHSVAPVKPTLSSKVQCPHHPKSSITSFCLKDDCSAPFVCSECKPHHANSHSKFMISVQSFFNEQLTKDYAKNLHSHFSCEHIENIQRETMSILNKMQDEVLRSITDLKRKAEEYFSNLSENVERLRQTYLDFTEMSNSSSSRSETDIERVKELIENYKILKRDIKVFDLSLDAIPSNLQKEAETVSNKFRFELLSKLNVNLSLKPIDFSKLKLRTSYAVPSSEGVLYEACAFISKWKVMAVGFRKNQQGSLGLCSVENHELLSSIPDAHKRWINHVIWVEKRNLVVTCSNDTKIKVFAASNKGRSLKAITTFRGHTNLVRCIKYINEEDLLISAGDDADIKIWDLAHLKRSSTISTGGQTNMDGSIAYIPKDKLVGVGFRAGFIRFYHLYKKNLVLDFKTGFENFYTYSLQYLPKRKIILGRVKENVIKLWTYDDEKKKVEQYKTINAKGSYPDCIVANEDESQLLFTSRDPFLEAYDFASDKTSVINLHPHIKKTNALVLLENLGKVSVCDYTSGKVCVLH